MVQRESQQYTDRKVESLKEELLGAVQSLRGKFTEMVLVLTGG